MTDNDIEPEHFLENGWTPCLPQGYIRDNLFAHRTGIISLSVATLADAVCDPSDRAEIFAGCKFIAWRFRRGQSYGVAGHIEWLVHHPEFDIEPELLQSPRYTPIIQTLERDQSSVTHRAGFKKQAIPTAPAPWEPPPWEAFDELADALRGMVAATTTNSGGIINWIGQQVEIKRAQAALTKARDVKAHAQARDAAAKKASMGMRFSVDLSELELEFIKAARSLADLKS